MSYSGPFTTVSVRHYEAMLGVVRAAKEVIKAAEIAGSCDAIPVHFISALRDRLADWECER